MAKFDRYLLSQIMVLFGFFSLVLVMIYWVNRAVVLFDQLIANGQSAVVFLEFTALSLPNVIRLVLPIAGIAATLYATNRLASESELVVVQATGYSPTRLARPVLLFGLVVAGLLSVLTHFLVPAAVEALDSREAEIAENITARLLREGQFLHPAANVTLYIRAISPDGELIDTYLSDSRDTDRRTTYTAERALFVRSESGPKLVMFNGLAQNLLFGDRRLSVTEFSDFSFDIGALVTGGVSDRRQIRAIPTLELLAASDALQAETGASARRLTSAAHDRFNQAAVAAVGPVLAFSVMMLGGFSRFGLWRQVFGAVVVLIAVKSLDNAMATLYAAGALPAPAAYAASGVALLASWLVLSCAGGPLPFMRRARRALA